MNDLLAPASLVVLVPLLAAVALAALRQRPEGAWLNLGAAAATFVLAWRLPLARDALFPLLACVAGLTSAWSIATDPLEAWPRRALSQLLLSLTLAALLSDGIATMWVLFCPALLAAAAILATPLTADSLRAASRFLLLGTVGLALALFGLVALYLAGRPAAFDPRLMSLAWVMLVFGARTLAGLAAIGTLAIAAFQLAPLALILRLRPVLAAHALAPGPLLLALGLASLLVGAFGAWRERDAARAFASVDIGHLGVVLWAFGVGSADACFAGLFALTLIVLHWPTSHWAMRGDRMTRIAAIGAAAGLPPFGLFPAWFLVMAATLRANAWLALPLGAGLVALGWAVARQMSGDPPAARGKTAAPVWIVLAIGIALGYAMPAPVADWLALAAQSLQ